MNIIKLEVYVIDFDDVGSMGVAQMIEDARYPNDCIVPKCHNVQVKDIGKWSDDHPLNKQKTFNSEIERLFK